MIGATAELENIPLRDTHVLNDLPGRVRNILYSSIDQLDGKIFDDAVEVHVRAAAAQNVE